MNDMTPEQRLFECDFSLIEGQVLGAMLAHCRQHLRAPRRSTRVPADR